MEEEFLLLDYMNGFNEKYGSNRKLRSWITCLWYCWIIRIQENN